MTRVCVTTSLSPLLAKMFRYFILLACFFAYSCATTNYQPPTAAASMWMEVFDQNKDTTLDWNEFSSLCDHLFRNIDTSERHPISQLGRGMIFGTFDRNSDGHIDSPEFNFCYIHWIHTILHPRSALVVIDVQNDFISGSLKLDSFPAKHNGEDVVRLINRLLDTVPFTKVYYSQDWHPSDHVSFIDNVNMRTVDPSSNVSAANAKVFDTVVFQGPPKMSQRLWPRHCVEFTMGAELHKDLKLVKGSDFIFKGTNPDIDSYSVFWDNNKKSQTPLQYYLMKEGITDVYVAGLAYDVCVGASASDAQKLGYRTVLIDDCTRGVDLAGIDATRHSVWTNHGVIAYSHQIKAMVEGKDRRPELGLALALQIGKNLQNGTNHKFP